MTEGGRWGTLCHRFIVQLDTQTCGENRLGPCHPFRVMSRVATLQFELRDIGLDRSQVAEAA